MNTGETMDDLEVESRPVRAVRLTFLGSLLFWPFFVFGNMTMLGAPGKTTAAEVKRDLLVYGTLGYPLAVALGWYLCRRGVRRGRADLLCLLPWLIPTIVACYWLGYFLF